MLYGCLGMSEPGLDREYWETEWEQFQEDLETSPSETLFELDDLIARMLVEVGYPTDSPDPVDDEGIDPEILTTFHAARETTRAVDRGDDVDPGDVAQAVNDYREIYEHLISREVDLS
jgi:hypothetical protein